MEKVPPEEFAVYYLTYIAARVITVRDVVHYAETNPSGSPLNKEKAVPSTDLCIIVRGNAPGGSH